ncbi:uncharacterized protein LOC141661623 isoform X2 [Apium graveolens]|uniref:uncharacterized protein LOC141661623 isoform X2 n=1 Tax=Apium graveolens TaxID=4045 RepID=UPI003D7B8009
MKLETSRSFVTMAVSLYYRVIRILSQQPKVWIIIEYMAGGSVADSIQPNHPLDEMFMACILRDLLYAAEYLHNEGKFYRDIEG